MSQAPLLQRPFENSNLFSGHYLDERIQHRDEWDCDEEAETALNELQSTFELEEDLVKGYKEDALIHNWIDEVLGILGFDTNVETTLPGGDGFVDILLFENADARRGAAKTYLDTQDTDDLFSGGAGLVEAKQWEADFTQRFSEQRPYRNASHQIKHYLERTPENIQWGILTNGRKWRLYGTKDYETETYYEVDLPELLEHGDLEAFKYFYVFFRPEAFRETGGSTFLDDVWSESETAAQELGEDLQDNIFTALRVLGRGFVETNDLAIDPDNETELDRLKEQSLVLLYRLMFLLYAESRGLIHPEGQAAKDEFEQNFSLDELRLEIHDQIGEVPEGFDDSYSEYSTTMWSRLEDLFRLIDQGEESLGIPPYNGGLFDREKHEFLAEHEVSNQYLAEVIYRISTTENGDGRYVLADYGDLDTRHLGSVYEGLLEHQFRTAPEQYAAVSEDGGQVWKPATEVSVADAVETVPEGGLYVVNDEGERKATGAYYTPDYVVTYIVEETVGPLVDEIREDLIEQGFEPATHEYLGAFYRRVKELKILDPAMGSGHFLTRATGYLSRQVMDEVLEIEEATAFNEQKVRRDIAKECIYGVDLNGMAVELAKLSMWLETLAADQPLAFLDHHLKTGNSLVGSDVTEVLSNGDDGEAPEGQLTFEQVFGKVRQDTLDHVMDRMQELLEIDNETLEDVKSMEEIYDDIRADAFYQRLFELTNVHTAERFDLDVPEDAYERMAKVIDGEKGWAKIQEQDWFQTAQTMADGETFFHWELEYPEVFFDINGEKREDAGFDAVVSNPPYIRVQHLRQENPGLVNYLETEERYSSSEGRYDIYGPFVERGSQLASEGRTCYILPNKFIESGGGKPLRKYLVNNKLVSRLTDFSQHQIFQSATTYTCILSLSESQDQFEYREVTEKPQSVDEIRFYGTSEIAIENISSKPWVLTSKRKQKVLDRIKKSGDALKDISTHIFQGMKSGDNDVLFVEVLQWGEQVKIRSPVTGDEYLIESELVEPIILGKHIHRYAPPESDLAVIYPYEVVDNETTIISEEDLGELYPKTYDYLCDFKNRLDGRRSEHMRYETWYALNRPRDKEFFENPKIIVPDICEKSEFTLDGAGEYYIGNTGYGIVPSDNTESTRHYLLAVLNSSITWFYIYLTSTVLENDFRRFLASYLGPLPIPEAIPKENSIEQSEEFKRKVNDFKSNNELPDINHKCDFLAHLGGKQTKRYRDRSRLNLSLSDHLGSYSDGQTLADIGFAQPPTGAADSILTNTTEDRENLRVGDCEVVRESETAVKIQFTARYKPEDDDVHETDRWGYTETDPLPALQISDLSKTEADLIEAFVPVAVEEAGGFAGFRETATKTNSLVDRLRALTLPAVEDVRDGLESYLRTEERAEELETKIERTDQLIDEIVYDLYGLTDEEIEIVEEAVGK